MATAETTTLIFKVSGMTCGNCARSVTNAIQSAPGALAAQVDAASGEARVTTSPGDAAEIIIRAIKAAGYEARLSTSAASAKPSPPWGLIFAAASTLAMMVLEWGFGVGMTQWYHWLSFALAAPVQFWCGRAFYEGAWRQAKAGKSNMDTLVALGSTTAFLFSLWGLLSGWEGHLYFMDAVAILTFVTLGHSVEARMSRRAEAALQALMNLAPAQALRMEKGAEVEVPATSVRKGHYLVLKPGDRAPVDGRVVEGQSHAEESMLTGEPVPKSKKSGDLVHAGTINLDGRLVFKATATGEETALAKIIQAVRRAQQSRADIQRLADRISERFVPVVVVMALLTACWWGFFLPKAQALSHALGGWLWMTHGPETAVAAAIYHAASVLIVACPCAMGLATPVAIMAGTNAASRLGILVRDGIALEKAGNLSVVAFDKTGTLTEGRLGIREMRGAKDIAPTAEQLSIVAALAQSSRHPASVALHAVSTALLSVQNWREVRGCGIEAEVNVSGVWRKARLGSPRWITGASALPPSTLPGTQVVLELEGQAVCRFTLADQPKPGAEEAINRLRAAGLRVVVLSGDDPAAVAEVAAKVGLDAAAAFGGLSPEDKAATIRKFQEAGERVAFIGDGINDAPALAAADLGITVSKASDVARETAGIVLLRDDLLAVPQAIQIAGRTLKIIRQNLFWAFFYNAAAIPLAMCGLFSPMLSAIAMGASDIMVVGNALRLLGAEKR